MNKKTIIITSSITAVVVFLLTTLVFMSSYGIRFVGILSDNQITKNYGKLLKIDQIIENDYMGQHNSKHLMNMAMHAYVAALNDPYSSYYTEAEFKSLNDEINGEYRGIGVVVGSKNDEIIIKSVSPESPAEKAGILAGDVILAVNGTQYRGKELSKAINAIKETKVGQSVILNIRRNGTIMDVSIKIEQVKQVLVSSKILDESIGYIKLLSFGTNVAPEFDSHLKKLKEDKIKSLIIDLRDNPGGTLDSAVLIADLLLPEGNIVTIKDKKGNEDVYTSNKEAINLPMCVLINENSASASEVLSGALKDHKKAVIIGKRSFGKGVVQSIVDLGDGSGLSLTIAKYFTPAGVCIHGIGIQPDIEVDLPEGENILDNTENDTQLSVAINVLKK